MWPILATATKREFSFNPHTYMRCDVTIGVLLSSPASFNPHTYMRCDCNYGLEITGLEVSIHTPTWGVTHGCRSKQGSGRFQSTHLHEVWLVASPKLLELMMFQSTHLHEVWLNEVSQNMVFIRVSIHTPTWGVTMAMTFTDLNNLFQSTHLHEVWLIFA